MKTRKIKGKTIGLLIVITLMVGFFLVMSIRARTGGSQTLVSARPEASFTWFISSGENSNFYMDYAENPAVQYWCSQQFETGDSFQNTLGETSNIKFEFQIPPAGAGADTLNNLLGNKSTWPDIVNATYTSMTVKEAYENGLVIDLSPYIEKCMPNYMAMLEKNGIVENSMNYAEGAWRYLALVSFEDVDIMSYWSGYQYRRDWIIKYGTPVAGSQAEKDGGFTGFFTRMADGTEAHIALEDYNASVDGDSWTDNITFPSWEKRDDPDTEHGGMKWYADWCAENGKVWDGTDPVTISDWEWMFAFFQKAIAENNITDGYVHSIYYPGYNENGDFVTGFGGGGAHWYYNDDNLVSFGACDDGFKAYLRCMNSWWNNGWIDSEFSTKSTDAYYEIDDGLVRQGKVGCWFGRVSTLGTRIYKDDLPLTKGILVSAAAQPINDIYDGNGRVDTASGAVLDTNVAMQIPACFYGHTEYSSGMIWFSVKILEEGKNLELLLRALDYLYSENGSLLYSLGLSAEQLSENSYANTFYQEYGLTDGAYTTTYQEDGTPVYHFNPILALDKGTADAIAIKRLLGYDNKKYIDYGYEDTYRSMLEQYSLYSNDRFFGSKLTHYVMTDDEQKLMSQTYSRITTTYLYQEVPRFIKGQKDISTEWDDVVQGLITRGVQKVCDINNAYLLDSSSY